MKANWKLAIKKEDEEEHEEEEEEEVKEWKRELVGIGGIYIHERIQYASQLFMVMRSNFG